MDQSQRLQETSDNGREIKFEPAFSSASTPFDPLRLLADANKQNRDPESKATQPFGTPSIYDKSSAKHDQAPKQGDIADRVINRIKDSADPVQDIKTALKKLDNLLDASITRYGQTSHVDINLKHGQTVAPPNIQVRGFRPVASHLGSHLSFDLTPTKGGVILNNMEGFNSSVRGPLGRIRHSETTSMFLGKDAHGPYVQSSSDLYMRRRVHSSTTILREDNFPADSPMRSLMHHSEALDQVSSMLRMFQSTDDLNNLGIKRNGEAFDVKSESKSTKNVELNFKPDKLPIPITVKSLDLDKTLSASLTQEKDSVSLKKIGGLKVNVEIAGARLSVCPTQVSIEKGMLKMELKNPSDGSAIPLSIPIAKLKEAGKKH